MNKKDFYDNFTQEEKERYDRLIKEKWYTIEEARKVYREELEYIFNKLLKNKDEKKDT